MVFQIAGLVIIPIILTIVSVSPFEAPSEEESEDVVMPETDTNFPILFFALLIVWLLLIIRILYQLKRGTFKIQNRF